MIPKGSHIRKKKDPLDKFFVDQHIKCSYCGNYLGYKKSGHYYVKEGTIQNGNGRGREYSSYCSRRCVFMNWLNTWGDFYQNKETLDYLYTIGKKPNHITNFGRGYRRAISDVYERMEKLINKEEE